jgi:hypothetical protein
MVDDAAGAGQNAQVSEAAASQPYASVLVIALFISYR